MIRFFAIISLILVGLNSVGQLTQTVRGRLIDKYTKTPIIGATVIVENTDPFLAATSDMEGKFKIREVPVGRQTIIVRALGYNPIFLRNIEVTSSKEVVLELAMEEKVIESEEVVITSKKEKARTNNEMVSVSGRTFSVDETKRYAGSLNDVSRMAQNFAGVQGSNDARNDIVIRGNSPIGVLYRLEGMDIPNPNHFATNGTTGGPISILNNNVLSNSDFLTGAFPAEYGNALAGVFDLRMRNGNNETFEFLGQVGFNGAEFLAEGPIDRESGASYLASYRYSTLELFELMGFDFGTAAVPSFQDGSFKLNFPHKEGNTSIFGLGGTSYVEVLDSDLDGDDLYASSGEDVRFGSDMGAVGVSHTQLLSRNTYIKATISTSANRQLIEQDSLSTDDGSPVPYYRNNSTQGKQSLNVYVNHRFSAKNIIKVGGFFDRKFFSLSDSIYRATFGQFFTLKEFDGSTYLLQPYAQWQYRPNDKWTFNSGLHYQHFTLNNSSSVEPRFGFKWRISPINTLSLGYGLHSLLLPTQVYFERVQLPGGDSHIPNRDLSMMKAHHLVLGYDRALGENLRFKTEVYYQDLFDVPVDVKENTYSMLNQGADFGIGFPDTMQSTGTGKNYGVEFTLEQFLTKGFYYLATVSLYESKYTGSDGVERNTAFNGNYTVNVLAGKEFELNKNKENKKRKTYITLNVRSTYQGGNRYTPILLDESIQAGRAVLDWDNAYAEKYADYFRTDVKIGIKVNGKVTQELRIDLQNITDRDNIFQREFDPSTDEINTVYQIGFLPILQYRILF